MDLYCGCFCSPNSAYSCFFLTFPQMDQHFWSQTYGTVVRTPNNCAMIYCTCIQTELRLKVQFMQHVATVALKKPQKKVSPYCFFYHSLFWQQQYVGPKCIMFNYVLAVKPSSSIYCYIIEECRKQSWIYSTSCLQNIAGKKIKVVMDILQNAFSHCG